MITVDTRLAAHPDVLFTRLRNGNAALLHLGTKTYFSLNTTGARIWQGISQGWTLGDVSQEMTREFDVNLNQAQTSVLHLADELVRSDLMQLTDA